MHKKTKAFTLIELIIVIAVVAILLAAVLITFNPNKRIKQAQDARRWTDVTNILKAANSYAVDHKAPFCANLGMDLTDDDQWRCLGPGLNLPTSETAFVCKVRPECPGAGANNENGSCIANEGSSLCCCGSLYDWEYINGGIKFTPSCSNGDLTCVKKIAVAQIEGDWTGQPETNFINIKDWTTDADYYIKIYTTGDARHNGVYGGNPKAYRLEPSSLLWAVKIEEKYTKIDGLQIKPLNRQYSYGIGGLEFDGVVGQEYSNNIIQGHNGQDSYGISMSKSYKSKIFNNIIYNFNGTGSGGIHIGSCVFGNCINDSYSFIYNNTIANSSRGIKNIFWASIIKNNLIYNCTDPYCQDAGEEFKAAYNNASDGAGAEYPDAQTSENNRKSPDDFSSFSFLDAGNFNFHLASTDIGAKDFGVDLSNDSYLSFTDDIDGGIRGFFDSLWDIGADEYGTGACCDLGTDLVDGGYLAKMPEDPVEGDLAGLGNAGYYIKRALSGEIWVSAPHKSEFYDQNKDIMVTE